MKYENLKTNAVISKRDLQTKLNMSFPDNYIPEGYIEYSEPEVSDVVKEAARLKSERDLGQYDPIEVDGLVFDANFQSQINIETAIRKFDVVSTDGFILWTLQDNSTTLLTKEQLIKVEDEITLRYVRLHKEYTEFKLKNIDVLGKNIN